MKKIILLTCLIPLSVMGEVINSSPELQGIEQLMGGLGLARIGSQGSMTANPSLLAFLPKKQEFLSVNKISFYKLKGSETNTEIKPEVIPSYAVTTEGFGDWGHSYGLSIQSYKIEFDYFAEGSKVGGVNEQEFITLAYGLGKKIDPTSAWGASLTLGRNYVENRATAFGTSGGMDYLATTKETTSAWILGTTLGATKVMGDYAFGISTKLGLGKFGVISRQQNITQVSGFGTNEEKSSEVPRVRILPSAGLGVKRDFSISRLYVDINYSPSYSDDEGSYNKATYTYGVGYESLTFIPKIQVYSGLRYAPKVNREQSDTGLVSAGLSKKGKHSTSFAGLNWSREILKSSSEVIGLIFGTKFEY